MQVPFKLLIIALMILTSQNMIARTSPRFKEKCYVGSNRNKCYLDPQPEEQIAKKRLLWQDRIRPWLY